MRKILSLLLFFIFISISQGQNTGIYPPVYNWKQINTDTVRLIFLQGMEDKAQRVSFITHLLAKNDTLSFDQRLRKVNVFLINNTAESNGYIRFAPFHGKFFSTAPQYAFAGTIDWFDFLTIHEYRHVMQMNGGTRGLSFVARKLFGESFWGSLLVLGAPSWFFEGDAVMQETAFSYSGRGRVPEFKMRFQSIANMEKPFSYEKMMCGSYKDIIPDQYALGYQLIEHGISNYGSDVWNKVYKDAITYKKLLYPFSRSLKRHTGLSTKRFFQEVINDHKNNRQTIEPMANNNSRIMKTGKELEFYSNPKFCDSMLYIVKSSFKEAPYIVSIDPENDFKTKKTLPVGFGFGKFDVSENTIIWNEINEDKRWSGVSYSNIYKYDFKKNEIIQISRGKMLFHPVISPDNEKIAVIEADEKADYQIVIIDYKTGIEIKKIPNPDYYFIRELDWIDNENLVFTANRNNENSLMSVDVNNNNSTVLIPYITQSISDLCVTGDNVFFTSFLNNESSVQEIFSFDIKNKKLLRKKAISQYGQFMPAITDRGNLIYCEKEFNKTSLVISQDYWKDLFYESTTLLSLKEINHSGDGILDYPELLDKKQTEHYPVEDFKPHFKIFIFHSWFPLYLNPNITATFLSRDYLDRLHLNLTTGLNLNDKSFYLSTEMEYGEFYPVISLSMENVFNQEGAIRNNDTGVFEKYRFNSIKLSSSIGIPLTFQKLNNRTSIFPQIAVNAFRNFSALEGINDNEQFRVDFKVNVSYIKLQSLRSVVPEKSSFFNFRIYNIQDPGDYFGATFNYTYYLPSFFTNHGWGIRLGGLYNSSEIPSLKFADINSSFYYARGYNYNSDRKSLGGIKVNYSFPLLYPDFSVSKFIFFKRIRANIFFDIDRYKVIDETSWKNQRSAGLEFIFDNVYFRMFKIPIGIGFDYLMDVPEKRNQFNFRLLLGF